MIETISEVVIGLLVLFGAMLSLISAFGLIRLPDVYLRSHAATKSTTLGVMSILLAVLLYFMVFGENTSGRLLLGILFVFITAPVAGQMIGRAAYRSGVPLWKKSVRDDLKDVVHGEHLKRKKEL